MSKFDPIIEVNDDGLENNQIGPWALEKYSLVGGYCEVFTRAVRQKWDNLVYIDLFAGSGYSKIRNRNKIIYGSPLIALSIPIPFTTYIFCEKNKKYFESLKERLKRDFNDKNVILFNDDSNDIISKVKSSIPKYSRDNTVLSFCYVDPFSLNLRFETIRELSFLSIDFLILLALYMDANRNIKTYLASENKKVELFLDDSTWKEEFKEKAAFNHERFVRYLANIYKSKMENLGFKTTESFRQVRSEVRNLPLYYLAFFSKHNLGKKLWNEVQKYADTQRKLF